eukprot:CAMPEP_0206040502 /NCGR_PEP_ID=MMETSP1466-20131121/5418_1 /ASSEMBLY_ACC=CAM_ASM_001126 /TAXON_ID=44452 /ORGANISM="Pavlova gyrans, Strain CCMP608" /LENGTH=384 /DNA_ID=CAMNT_0053415181 /DNA_START=17 /DNA_END=1171 /DNA_ORIENTATION=-
MATPPPPPKRSAQPSHVSAGNSLGPLNQVCKEHIAQMLEVGKKLNLCITTSDTHRERAKDILTSVSNVKVGGTIFRPDFRTKHQPHRAVKLRVKAKHGSVIECTDGCIILPFADCTQEVPCKWEDEKLRMIMAEWVSWDGGTTLGGIELVEELESEEESEFEDESDSEENIEEEAEEEAEEREGEESNPESEEAESREEAEPAEPEGEKSAPSRKELEEFFQKGKDYLVLEKKPIRTHFLGKATNIKIVDKSPDFQVNIQYCMGNEAKIFTCTNNDMDKVYARSGTDKFLNFRKKRCHQRLPPGVNTRRGRPSKKRVTREASAKNAPAQKKSKPPSAAAPPAAAQPGDARAAAEFWCAAAQPGGPKAAAEFWWHLKRMDRPAPE